MNYTRTVDVLGPVAALVLLGTVTAVAAGAPVLVGQVGVGLGVALYGLALALLPRTEGY